MSSLKWVRFIFALCLVPLLSAVPASAQFLGVDRTGDGVCGTPADMGINPAVNSQTYDIDIVFDLATAFSANCAFCIQDSLTVDESSWSFAYNTPGTWTDTPARRLAMFELDPTLVATYPTLICWLFQSVDFTFSSPFAFDSNTKYGTFSFDAATDECIGFVMDGAGSGYFLTTFATGDFSGTGETCDPFACPTSEPLAINQDSPACPGDVKVGDPFGPATFLAIGGVPPYSWSIADQPSGIDISSGTGEVSGTPDDTPGTYNYTITLTDSDVAPLTKTMATRQCSMELFPADLLVDTQAPSCPLPSGEVGQLYDGTAAPFTATGGIPPYTWAASNLPAGLSINVNSGEIVGTPTTPQFKSFTVTVTDAQPLQAQRQCQITIAAAPLVIDDICPIADGTVGEPYGPVAFTFTGGKAPFTWSGSGLPDGLDIGSSSGELSGTPTTAGTDIPIAIMLVDGDGTEDALNCTLTINNPPLVINTVTPSCPLGDGTEGEQYTPVTFTATGGGGQLFWEVTGQPDGMNIDGVSGEFGGAPTENGIFQMTVMVSDGVVKATLDQDTRNCQITIDPPPAEGVDVQGPGVAQEDVPGQTVTHAFTVVNLGDNPADFVLSAVSDHGWSLLIGDSLSPVTINIVDNAAVDVHVTIPGNVDCAIISDIVTLTATKSDNGSITDNDDATTNVDHGPGGVTVAAQLNGVCIDPGATGTAFFDVTNTGNCPEEFDLVPSVDMVGWTVELTPTVGGININQGDTLTVSVDVIPPADGACFDQASVTLTATGLSTGATGDDSVTETVCPIETIDAVAPDGLTGAPGDTLEYCFDVTNTGNCAFSVDISLASEEWTVLGDNARIPLQPGGSDQFCVFHVIPENAQVGENGTFCLAFDFPVILKGAGVPLLTGDTLCVTSTVGEAPCNSDFTVTAQIGNPVSEMPGDTLTLLYDIDNLGDPDAYNLFLSDSLGWAVSLPDGDMTGEFQGTHTVPVEVQIPENALCTDVNKITLAVQSKCAPNNMIFEYETLGVEEVCAVRLEALTSDQTGGAGDVVSYDFRYTNIGNCDAMPGASFASEHGWNILPSPAPQDPIPPGGVEIVTIEHTIPADAIEGDEDRLDVCFFCIAPRNPAKGAVFVEGDSVCVSVTTRVLETECDQGQPILALGDVSTVDFDGTFWTVQIEMINTGPGEARSITAVMDHDIAWLNIPDPTTYYGDLPQGGRSSGEPSNSTYQFDLTGWPGGSFNIWFDVTYTDTCGIPYQVRLDPEFVDPESSNGQSPVSTQAFLHRNVPNPFNPQTRITVEIPSAGYARLIIYNAAGQLVRVLHDGSLSAGEQSFYWYGKDERGADSPSGTYFYSLESGGQTATRRMILIR